MCGSKKLRRQKRDIFLESQKKMIKAVSIWVCESCGEEFLDDSSREKLYKESRVARRRRPLAA
jgi:YgiT-type zinc finger domain-containing protein